MADLIDHVGEVLVIDAADPLQLAEVALGQQVEIVDQTGHRRIEAVAFLQLQHQAFGEITGGDAGRIECMEHGEHGLDPLLRGTETLGHRGQIGAQIAGVVDAIDQILADHTVDGIVEGDGKLDREVIG